MQLKSLSSYQIKKIKLDKTTHTIPAYSLGMYKRFISWFRENMLVGIEPPIKPNQLPQDETINRNMSDFFDENHDFSVVLYAKEFNKPKRS